MKQLILASKSPRRKELLEKCGLPFIVEAADIDETIDTAVPLPEAIRSLSLRKAEAVLAHHPEAVIIGSDTIVAADNCILGKPHSREEARSMLEKLSGRSHQVITGVAIISRKRTFSECTVNDVHFDPLSTEEIIRYIDSGEPMDKAGAYAIQGEAGKFISAIHGDYYSIMGLPLSIVYQELKNLELY